MSSPQQPVRSDFSRRLRSSTRTDHDNAQRAPFIQALLAGELGADAYAGMLAQHYFVYQALEEAADYMRADLIAGPFISDRLRRLPALESDLHFFLGPNWQATIQPCGATEEYRARVREVCFNWPGGFVAHHYTRYLADLSGGQIIRSAMSRCLDLPGEDGFAFFTFEGIPSRPRFKDAYRTLLDTAGWDQAEQDRIIAETRYAFRLNTQVLIELGRHLPPSIPAPRD